LKVLAVTANIKQNKTAKHKKRENRKVKYRKGKSKMKKLTTKTKAKIVTNVVNDRETYAKFDYVDRKGKYSSRLVRLDSLKPDANDNWIFYCYSNGLGNGGGVRSFKGSRIFNFRVVDGVNA
jgi:hypothetical protein